MAIKKIIRSLPEFLREGKNLNDIVDVLEIEFNNVGQAIATLKEEIQINTSTDGYLEDIAKIFNLSRKVNESDSQFKARIKAFWPGFSGSGTINDLKNVINRITGISVDNITITEIPDMKFLIDFNIGANFDLVQTVKDLVFQNKAAGTYPFFSISSGFNDNTSASDSMVITVLAGMIWDNFTWDSNITYN